MSMTDPDCERSDLPQSMCAHCRGLSDAEPPTAGLRITRFITAQYAGVCIADPTHHIEPGEDIGLAVSAEDESEQVGWLCTGCVRAVLG